jgi:hypothetical protein
MGVIITNERERDWEPPTPYSVTPNGKRVYHKFLGESQAGPQAQIIEFEPGAAQATHSHGDDELLFVLEGELHLGDSVHGPGTAVFIEKHSNYAPSAGPQGLKFLRCTAASITWGGAQQGGDFKPQEG